MGKWLWTVFGLGIFGIGSVIFLGNSNPELMPKPGVEQTAGQASLSTLLAISLLLVVGGSYGITHHQSNDD